MAVKCISPNNPLYIVKFGCAGDIYIFFLFLIQNIDCEKSLEPPQRGHFYSIVLKAAVQQGHIFKLLLECNY